MIVCACTVCCYLPYKSLVIHDFFLEIKKMVGFRSKSGRCFPSSFLATVGNTGFPLQLN